MKCVTDGQRSRHMEDGGENGQSPEAAQYSALYSRLKVTTYNGSGMPQSKGVGLHPEVTLGSWRC